MFYRNAYLFYGKEGGITIFCACIKAGAGLVDAVGMLFHKTAYSFLASKQGQDLWTLGKSR